MYRIVKNDKPKVSWLSLETFVNIKLTILIETIPIYFASSLVDVLTDNDRTQVLLFWSAECLIDGVTEY